MPAVPRWSLDSIYPSLTSKAFKSDFERLTKEIAAFRTFVDGNCSRIPRSSAAVASILKKGIDRRNSIALRADTLGSYIFGFVSTDSKNKLAASLQSKFEVAFSAHSPDATRFQRFVGVLDKSSFEAALRSNSTLRKHEYWLREAREQAKYMMSDAEESLASALTLSGGSAWGKLQGTVTSQLSVDVTIKGKKQTMPMPALINLRAHPDEAARRAGYEAENRTWESVQEVLAACLNGVKGEDVELDRRRKRKDPLHAPCDSARIDRKSLDAMIGAIEDSLPMFRRYFSAKAKILGKKQLAWWDLFAPVGKNSVSYSYRDACNLVVESFARFSPDLAAFARRNFESGWVDAESRFGKRGGAFCMGVPGVKESRIMMNFDGSLDQTSTLAHELGHAFHNDCQYAEGKTSLQQITPMTLAETASIMCEAILMSSVLDRKLDPKSELAVLDTQLIGDAQVIVDIYSRFIFEKEVYDRRVESELSAEDFCDIMERAQKKAYGSGLDPKYLQKYMWTWKPHYYSAGNGFYNFPYAFGLLFATGLYSEYRKKGPSFVARYRELLASTGEGSAAQLARRFGIDIRSKSFWLASLGIIGERIERYISLAKR